MNGLTYYRYNSNTTFNSYSPTDFSIFNTKYDGTGTISTIQLSNNNNLLTNNYGFTNNQYIGLKISGYFTPDVTGTWQFQLGYELPNDDLSYLWIGDSALKPTTSNALGMTYYWSDMVTVKIDLVAGKNYPILIYWGQSWGGFGISNGIIPPNGKITYDGSKYYSSSNLCDYQMSSTELQCYQNNYPDLKGLTPAQLQQNWITTGCMQNRNNKCPSYQDTSGLYNYIGCYNDNCYNGGKGPRAIPNYRGLVNSVDDCATIATSKSETLFGLECPNCDGNNNKSQCWTGSNLEDAKQYGENFNKDKCAASGVDCTLQVYQRSNPFPPPQQSSPELTDANFANKIENFENYSNNKFIVILILIFIIIMLCKVFKFI